MNILIRADSSNTIGIGHIMRDLVLAKQFPEDCVCFASRDLSGNIIGKIPYKTHLLETNSLEELSLLILQEQIEMLIIDHYEIDYKFEKELKRKHPDLKLMVLDDTYKKHSCDILLNHNIYAHKKEYKNLVPKACEIRCGEKYTLLREEFSQEKRFKILIAMGGADTQKLNIKILKALHKYENIDITLITTRANANLATLQKYVQDRLNISLVFETNELATLARESSFAIITPSVLANEFFAIKVPFIAIQTAPNQEYMYRFLKKKHYKVLKKFNAKELAALVKEYM
ncbi:MAG: UDP-2,4-diacetamido-2,4,6-trideoxy-beta-L-altropyranose hydrolase [Sulfurimonas sp.]|nr:UDP-2,4-diacetamido-2,4,6-trideoxy-beta-L-altropyranose hydrolase [Sulfurimonas sp.]MBU3938346.1 UDP-2,4-diacetamido-2,4,6-trideoxy-beta-L-altropyranose hydrolase [bacterium]MBU4025148.1 UDP-2,4-diacetamido-2,4,6-trideoxy-beta-L-altropyranose hydrolase [bacterium]MBU4057928.1 UDP-2,4-diacetamido-2,4,6-trideoxy-beta-L-altropyranose hydrolase [bacterium]MBU4109372.1 UDP-2,4-diacetamido-2,4,6-trideoxy-beta-L-altropyranose hydrolase [bacterium]